MVYFLLPPFPVPIMKRVMLFLLLALLTRFLHICVFSHLFDFLLAVGTLFLDSGCVGAVLGVGFLHPAAGEIGFDFLHFLLHAVVHLVDEYLFLLVLPVEGVGLVLVVQVVDAAVGPDIVGHPLRLTVVDLLHLPQVLHVHLVPHLVVHDAGSRGRVYHQRLHRPVIFILSDGENYYRTISEGRAGGRVVALENYFVDIRAEVDGKIYDFKQISYPWKEMNETYDVVVCGTGLIECILSGLLSQEGKKVLHIDRNPYYGGEGASVNLTNLWKIFREKEEPNKQLGHNRDWNIDLIPKYIMYGGKLVKILLKTRVSKYLEWKPIDGTYVLQNKEGGFFSKGGLKIFKVPVTPKEALASDLMGLFEKRRCQKFLEAVQNFEEKNPKTHEGIKINNPAKEMLAKYELEDNTVDFIGHAVALYTNDNFLQRPAIDLIRKIQLYMDSMGKNPSPFIYPIFGLGGIPEGFSRISAVNGGTFMLNTDINEILYENGKVVGVKGPDGVAKCTTLICDPTYVLKCGLKDRVKQVEKIIRCICILDHPIPNTENTPSVQIILPQRQLGRKNDIYVMMVSSVHCISKKDYYVAIVSTTVESNNPEQEIEVALAMLGKIKEKFITISERYIPTTKSSDGLFISESFDATSHFENETENVLRLYTQITGKELDLENLPEDVDE